MRIKFVSKTAPEKLESLWSALVPTAGISGVTFTFDPDAQDYDFLAVYEDLPPLPGDRKILRQETLACPRMNTLLITPEPSSIRLEGLNYLAQYGMVLTSRPFADHERQRLSRTTHIHTHAYPLRWFYGRDMSGDNHWSLAQIEASPLKTGGLSTVTSNKAMDHTVHAARLSFVKALKNRLGDKLGLFGRGFDEVDDKAEAMAPYHYHLAIENHIQVGHHTEKLTDCFLAETMPFYFGDPDYAQHYPKYSVIPIDIFNLDKSADIIRNAMAVGAYHQHRAALKRAKEIALLRSNPLRVVANYALARAFDRRGPLPPIEGKILGRHAFRRAHPLKAAQDAAHNTRICRSGLTDPLQGYCPL